MGKKIIVIAVAVLILALLVATATLPIRPAVYSKYGGTTQCIGYSVQQKQAVRCTGLLYFLYE